MFCTQCSQTGSLYDARNEPTLRGSGKLLSEKWCFVGSCWKATVSPACFVGLCSIPLRKAVSLLHLGELLLLCHSLSQDVILAMINITLKQTKTASYLASSRSTRASGLLERQPQEKLRHQRKEAGKAQLQNQFPAGAPGAWSPWEAWRNGVECVPGVLT